MVVGAAIVLFVTATLGAAVLGFWDDPERRRVDRRSFGLGVVHVAAATTAVVAWVFYLIGRSSGVGTATLGILVGTGVLGLLTLISTWQRDRSARYSEDRPDPVPAAVLVLHGAAAVVALVLVIVTVAE